MKCGAGLGQRVRDERVVILGGVSGSGMIGLARMSLQKGYRVFGCDRQKSEEVGSLESGGLIYFHENEVPPVEAADLVVCSSALSPEHPLREWARSSGAQVMRRAEMLAALLSDREVILVIGTHGKTTSAVLLAHALRKLGRDISFYIGAEVPLFGTSAYFGQDSLAVVEADESDGSFTCFKAAHVLVLNIEEDHLDHYSELEEIKEAFCGVVAGCRGSRVICGDDFNARDAFINAQKRVMYGFTGGLDIRGDHWKEKAEGSVFQADFGDGATVEIEVALNGRHNALNVLGVSALCVSLGYSPEKVASLFADVRGARRRFEVLVDNEYGTVVDDYAHHPTEIRATVRVAAKKRKRGGRLVSVFQPHRFSRTEKLMEHFVGSFENADEVHITEVYGAGERAGEANAGQRLAEAVGKTHSRVFFHESLENLKAVLRREWRKGDLLLVMGAGDINEVAKSLADEICAAGEISNLVKQNGECLLYEPLSRHTSLRVGGAADVWVTLNRESSLAEVLYYAKTRTIKVYIIGRGTNLIVRDNGIRGICCHLEGGEFDRMEFTGEQVYCGVGVRLKQLVAEAKKRDLGGLEFMEGIPGNLGGALCMNAGAMQSWTYEVVKSVRMMDLGGSVLEIPREAIEVRYRHVPVFEDHIALGATLNLVHRTREEINEMIGRYSAKRWQSQPPKPSAGCSFKNPGEVPAGQLIEELGLKGKKIGGAEISTVHGNFIVNDSGATAEDVIALIHLVEKEAKERRGIIMETEVIIIGE